MKVKSRGRFIAAIATFALAMGAVVGVQAAPAATGANCTVKSTPKNAVCDLVIYGALHRVTSLDANKPSTGGYTDSQMSYIIQGKLYRFDANGVPRRDLVAKAETSSDGKTVTHTLRDAKYSDGTVITAADAVNGYKRWVDLKISSSYIDAVQSSCCKGCKNFGLDIEASISRFQLCA
jgi:ABC-type oligopeptide transport system substrate-binding subunit